MRQQERPVKGTRASPALLSFYQPAVSGNNIDIIASSCLMIISFRALQFCYCFCFPYIIIFWSQEIQVPNNFSFFFSSSFFFLYIYSQISCLKGLSHMTALTFSQLEGNTENLNCNLYGIPPGTWGQSQHFFQEKVNCCGFPWPGLIQDGAADQEIHDL